MERIVITESEMLTDFEEALAGAETEDGHTLREIRTLTGWGTSKVGKIIRMLIVAGSWEAVDIRRDSPLRPGVFMQVCGYRKVVPSD